MVESGWRRVAAAGGGTVAGLTRTGAVVFAATPAGVRRSADGGRTWSIAGGSEGVPFAAVVVPSPAFERDQTVYAAGQAGAYRSRDGGQMWAPILSGSGILALAVAPGALFAGSEADGLLRSSDEGRSWSGANPGVLDLTILSIALSPAFERDRMAFLGTASGLYRSRTGGASWRAVELDAQEPAVQCLAVSPAFEHDRVVLAGTEVDGLLRSDDGGSTFSSVSTLEARTINALAVSASGEVAAATDHGVAISLDAGSSWRLASGATPGGVLSLVYLDDGALLAGLADTGVARSDVGGAAWSIVDEGLAARLLVRLAESDACLFAADLQGVVRVSRDAGTSWTQDELGLGGQPVTDLAAAAAGAVFAATGAGVMRGPTWQRVESLPSVAPRRVIARGARVLVVFDVHGIFESDDTGETWRSLAAPFRPEWVASAAFGPGRTVFVSTLADNEAVVWRSTDGGERWLRWLVEPAAGGDVLPLASDPTAEAVFVGLPGRVLRPISYATEVRGGERRPMWRSATLDQPSTQLTDLVLSPTFARDRTIVAGTNRGPFISVDGGEHFSDWSEGITPPSVVSLLWTDAGDVNALTLGGTLWRRPPPHLL